ncbi:hypothetical protein ABBQ32_010055 [Trebouxia sp. C0010 RCD-2024]
MAATISTVPQYSRMVDDQGVEMQPEHASHMGVSELTPLNYTHLAQQSLSQSQPSSGIKTGVTTAIEHSKWPVAILAGLVLTAVALVAAVVAANPGIFHTESKTQFLLVGDWGRDGTQNQSAVAALMATVADAVRPDFILSVGDNFYESGLLSVNDPQFMSSFTNVYNAPSLQVPWHAVLGNHDYGECWTEEECAVARAQCSGLPECYLSPLHQLDVFLWEQDWRWHCERNFKLSLGNDAVDLFFIDTNPGIIDYRTAAFANNTGGILQQSWQENLLELETQLARSTAQWKLVIGHHPVRRNNRPNNNMDLLPTLEPMLEKYGVQAYFCGHEHNLQYLHQQDSSVHYVVSGGGSLTDYAPIVHFDNGGSRFQYWGSGFVSCLVEGRSLRCDFYGITQRRPVYSIQVYA